MSPNPFHGLPTDAGRSEARASILIAAKNTKDVPAGIAGIVTPSEVDNEQRHLLTSRST